MFLKAFIGGIKKSLGNFRMTFMLYLLNVVFILMIVGPLYTVFTHTLGDSLDLEAFRKGFDNTVWGDLMNVHGDAFAYLMDQAIIVFVLYWLLNLFLNGGIIMTTYMTGGFSSQLFWSSCSHFCFRFVRLSLLCILLHLIVAGAIYGTYYGIVQNWIEGTGDERILVRSAYAFVALHAFVGSILLAIADYARIRLVQADDKWVLKSYWKGFVFFLRYMFPAYLLYILFLSLFVGLTVAYYFTRTSIVIEGWGVLIPVIIVQQLITFFRIFFRVAKFGGLNELYAQKLQTVAS